MPVSHFDLHRVVGGEGEEHLTGCNVPEDKIDKRWYAISLVREAWGGAVDRLDPTAVKGVKIS